RFRWEPCQNILRRGARGDKFPGIQLDMKPFALMAAALALLIGCGKSPDPSKSAEPNKKLMVALMPKSKGNSYFVSCKRGADQAAKDLGVELIFDGPTTPDPAKQNEIVENWITLGVDVIAAACENRDGIST